MRQTYEVLAKITCSLSALHFFRASSCLTTGGVNENILGPEKHIKR